MPPLVTTQPFFARDERVLCFHGELLYEAKVLSYKAVPSNTNSGHMYRVHYKGWKNTWDDWVPQERMRKLTDESKELAANLKKEMDAQRRAPPGKVPPPPGKRRALGSDMAGSSARGSEDRSSAAPPAPSRGTKRSREIEGIDKEEDFIRRPAVRLFMPDALKSVLVDDWEKVTKEQKLARVPAVVPASQALSEYFNWEEVLRKEGSAEADILDEVVSGLKEYFNKALGRILLYRFERAQFRDIWRQVEAGHGELAGKTLADVYGCEHLLRLLVSMPDLIAHTNMDVQAVARLREELSKLSLWLQKRIGRYFISAYEHPSQEYIDNAKMGA